MKKKKPIQKCDENKSLEKRSDQEFIAEMVGVKDYDFALSLLTSASNALEPFKREEDGLKAIMQSFRDLKPKDSIEARLIAQSAVLYEFTMKSLKQCAETSGIDFITAMANIGVKLMRVHNETIETLNKYRRGGEQKVTVTHAVVAGQAIVNNNYGDGGSPKNSGDTSCTQGNAEQNLRPMEIDHAETMPWPMDGAGCTEAKAQAPRRKKGKKG